MANRTFSHLDKSGRATMVGVAHKPDQHRVAVAEGRIYLQAATLLALKKQALPKGDVLTVAQIAGIQAAKQTSHLIPLCHPLPLHDIQISFELSTRFMQIKARAETIGKTGVEMEALTAVAIAALTIYDMCKAVDQKMRIGPIKLREKTKI